MPVISGNVSLYNETMDEPVYPTPVAGVLGLIEDVSLTCGKGFQREGDEVLLLGPAPNAEGLGGSEYLEVMHGKVAGRPSIDLELEKRVQGLCVSLIERGMLRSAHDCSMGGLAVALALCTIQGNVGARCEVGGEGRWDAVLFGEVQSRIVVSARPEDIERLREMARESGVPVTRLGVVGESGCNLARMLICPCASSPRPGEMD